jgi:hypothetical protein
MIPRFFGWLYRKLSPSWISLGLVVGLCGFVSASVDAAGWVRDGSAIGTALFLGAILGAWLAASRWSGWLALLYTPLMGLAFAAQAVGQVLPSGLAITNLPLLELLQLMNVRLFALFDRLSSWETLYRSGKSIGDTGLFVFVFCLLAWLSAAWLGWCVRRRRQALLGLLPTGLLLALNVDLSGQDLLPMAAFIAMGLLLVVRTAHNDIHRDWERRQVDYPDDLGYNWAGAGFSMVLIITLAARAAPLFGTPQGWRALADLFKPTQQQMEDTAVRVFGQVNPPKKNPLVTIRADTPQMDVVGKPPSQSNEVVFWVTTSDPPPLPPVPGLPEQASGPHHYWRSEMFATYTGQGWQTAPLADAPLPASPPLPTSSPGQTAALQAMPAPAGHYALRQTFELAARHGVELFGASQPQQVESRPAFAGGGPQVQLRRTQAGDSQLVQASPGALEQGSGQVSAYSVVSFVPQVSAEQLASAGTDYPPEIKALYLQLPASLPDRVRRLAARLGANAANPYELAMRIQSALRLTYPYSLTVPPPPPGQDAVDYFLFEAPGGFCSYYASAMTVLLRSQGVPARVAAGFASGSYDANRQAWAVPASAAHAWVEVYFPGFGWIEFEPTPSQSTFAYTGGSAAVPEPTPASAPAGFSLPTALTIALFGLIVLVGIGLLLGLLNFLGRGSGRGQADDPSRQAMGHYFTVRRALGLAGLAALPSLTPSEFLEQAAPALARQRGLASALERATALYQQAAYSPRPPAAGEVAAARQAWGGAFGEFVRLTAQHWWEAIKPVRFSKK